jgi:hypothetical protein
MLASNRALIAQQVLLMAAPERYGPHGDTQLERVEVLPALRARQARRLTA